MATYITTTTIIIRSSPDKNSNNVGSCIEGTTIEVSKTANDSSGNLWGQIDNGWVCLKYNGEDYVTTNVSSTNSYTVAVDEGSCLYERSSPSYANDSNKTGKKYSRGETITVVSFETVGSDTWAKLDNGNYVCKTQNGTDFLSSSGVGSDDINTTEAEQITIEKSNNYDKEYERMAQAALDDLTKSSQSTTGFGKYYEDIYKAQVEAVGDNVNNSLRMFGIPHQFTSDVDPRITGTSELGRNFTETMILEAPIIYVMPGKMDFLAGSDSKHKEGLLSVLVDAFKTGDTDGFGDKLKSMFETEDQDVVRYFGFKSDYVGYMNKVNMLCRICAFYLGIGHVTVPWHTSAWMQFGWYDWKWFSFDSMYTNNVELEKSASVLNLLGGMAAFTIDTITSPFDKGDDRWLRLYVDSSTSYSESGSNRVGDSILSQYTDQLSSLGRELQTVTGMSGIDISGGLSNVTSSLDDFIQKITANGGAIGTFLQRLTSNTNQILEGANFLVPQVWNDSSFSKGYDFTMTLSSPYGNPMSFYLNILVPLMHILGFSLPEQQTANTFKSPNIIRIFSPGWFSSDMAIVDQISIDKGSDGGWSVSKLPTDIKVRVSVSDLYTALGIPVLDDMGEHAAVNLMSNTGLLEYLMVLSGVNISNHMVEHQTKLIATLFMADNADKLTSFPWKIKNVLEEIMTNVGRLI